jgi:hypothetical protein
MRKWPANISARWRKERTTEFMICDLRFAILTAVALTFFQVKENVRAGDVLTNGDFETADPTNSLKPAGWDRVDGLGVQWTQAPDAAHGRAIRMDTRLSEQAMQAQWIKTGLTNLWNIPKPEKNAIAETYGLSLYSAAMPVKPGQTYRITFDFKGHGGGAKVWVRGYGNFAGEKRRRWETFVDCQSKGGGWTTQSQIFHPTKFRKEVTEMKVMLFAYYPAGEYWFDNIRIEPMEETETKPKN